MATVYILAGASGSGKSTFTKKLAETRRVHVCSADFFTYDKDGNFVPAKLSEAHGRCLLQFKHFTEAARPDDVIVVDNTNTTLVEMAPYYALGTAMGHAVEVKIFRVAPETAAARNVHSVPVETVKAQFARLLETLKTLPPWWKASEVEA